MLRALRNGACSVVAIAGALLVVGVYLLTPVVFVLDPLTHSTVLAASCGVLVLIVAGALMGVVLVKTTRNQMVPHRAPGDRRGSPRIPVDLDVGVGFSGVGRAVSLSATGAAVIVRDAADAPEVGSHIAISGLGYGDHRMAQLVGTEPVYSEGERSMLLRLSLVDPVQRDVSGPAPRRRAPRPLDGWAPGPSSDDSLPVPSRRFVPSNAPRPDRVQRA